MPTQAIVRIIGARKPGIKDTNFQVLILAKDWSCHNTLINRHGITTPKLMPVRVVRVVRPCKIIGVC